MIGSTDIVEHKQARPFPLHYEQMMESGAHPESFKGVLKKTRSRTQERIQKILVGGMKSLIRLSVN